MSGVLQATLSRPGSAARIPKRRRSTFAIGGMDALVPDYSSTSSSNANSRLVRNQSAQRNSMARLMGGASAVDLKGEKAEKTSSRGSSRADSTVDRLEVKTATKADSEASRHRMRRDEELEKLQFGKHIKPLYELPGFPMDIIQMRMRNRKLLASLNQKKRFKDFEYKNYDSTDSDIYEEEDYLKIQWADVEQELDYLKKRRLQRRFNVKLAIIQKKK